jgi:hypothetical protein
MMVVAPTGRPGVTQDVTQERGHYCPHCLRQVATEEARRQAHREACRSGAVDVSLLRCPTCGLVLCAEVLPEALHGDNLPAYAPAVAR